MKLIAIAAIALSPAVVLGQTRTHIRVTKDGSHASQSTGDVTSTPAPAPAAEPAPAPAAEPAPAPEPTPAPAASTHRPPTPSSVRHRRRCSDADAQPADRQRVHDDHRLVQHVGR